MTADTNEALAAKLREIASALDASGFFKGARDVCTASADMLAAQAAKLAEAEAAAEGALMILMDERAHADRLAGASQPFAVEASRNPDVVRLRSVLAAHRKRRAG